MTSTISPDAAIFGLSTLCVFLLKTIAAYGCCWLLARCATSASRRFAIWFLYLVGTSAFWFYSIARLFVPIAHSYNTSPAAPHTGITYVVPSQLTLNVVQLANDLILVYAIVLAIIACVGLWRRFQLHRALRLRLSPPTPIAKVFQAVSDDMGGPPCSLWVLPGLASPATLGSFRAAVYLPADCQDQDPAELRNILRHELKHVKRRDSLWETLSRTTRFFLFFHPLVHRAFAAARFEREVACDMAVVLSCPEKRDLYAETLVRFGWKTAIADKPDYIGIGFSSAAAILNARVGWILTGEEIYSSWSRKRRAVLSAGVLWLFLAGTPALWIAFRLAPLQQAPIVRSIQRRGIAAISRHGYTRQATRSNTPASSLPESATLSAPAAVAIHPASDTPHYHIQNADEPMSNPIATDESQPGSGTWNKLGSITNPHAPVPSATTVIIDTASQLSRMGVGRDHDRD
jgi:beta-lactamase regulating signal transducer with metallopeptidase domain